MSFKTVPRYKHIECFYFKTLNDALGYILDNHKVNIEKRKDNNRKYQHYSQSATKQTNKLG